MIDIVIPIHSIDIMLHKTISSVGLQKNINDINIILVGNYEYKDIEFILNKYQDIVNIHYIKLNSNIIDINFINKYVLFLEDNSLLYNSFSIIDMIDKIDSYDICIGKVININLEENYFLDAYNIKGKLYTSDYINKCKVEYNYDTSMFSIKNNIDSKYILLDNIVYMDFNSK